jgi:putative amino-acid transport system substrate-binding protein/putative amino-acid transport system permease protein
VSQGSNYEQIIREFDKNNVITIVTYENDGGMRKDVALGKISAKWVNFDITKK